MLKPPKLPTKHKKLTLGVLTSGGDAPGMNAAIRAVVRYGLSHGCQVVGIRKGYSGVLEKSADKLRASSVANIIQRGGTILKTDRCLEFYHAKTRKLAAQNLREMGIDALVVIGGNGSFTGAHLLEKETGIKCIGIPGTIDNDIAETEDTIGFDTAVNTAIHAIDQVRDTASSHDRIFLVEVMGRDSGFIAMNVGVGGGAETIIIPEHPSTAAEVATTIQRGIARGKTSSIIVVAEGRNPGLSQRIADQLAKKGYSAKVCILGHIQRGGTPTAHDRALASALGASAVAHLLAGKSNCMMAVQDGKIVAVPFKRMMGRKKKLDYSIIRLAQILAN